MITNEGSKGLRRVTGWVLSLLLGILAVPAWAETVTSVTQYAYDTAGRQTCTTVRMNPATFGSAQGACSLGTTGTDGPDRITYTAYDAANRVTQVTSGYGTSGTDAPQVEKVVTYTANGLEQTVADGKGNLTTYVYDSLDRLVRVSYPNPSTTGVSSTTDYEEYVYDAAGNRTSWRRRDGTTVAFTYDALNRANNGLRGETYAYDNLGHRISATYGGQTASAAFDALGRVKSETTHDLAMSYEYDPAGHRTKIIWPDSAPGFFVTYKYDAAGAVTEVRENDANLLGTFVYDDLGRRTWWGFGSPTVGIGYGYDAASRLSSLGFDLAGTAQDQTWTFAYNAASQVRTRLSYNSLYDWGGGQASKAYTVNGLNQYATVAGTTVAYDGRGNLTNDGTTAYGYDLLNNLTSVGTTALTYEPSGRLGSVTSGGTTTKFLYAGSDLVAEYNGSTLLRRYVPGPGTDAPIVWYEGSGLADRRWLLADPQGSVVAAVTSAGATIATNTYDEYGIPAAGNVGRFQYTGQAWIPEAGLYHYKARAYSPTLGRFLQTDPIGYGDGLNWYAYVGNDPLNQGDPTGESAVAPVFVPACGGGGWVCVTGAQAIEQTLRGMGIGALRLARVSPWAVGLSVAFTPTPTASDDTRCGNNPSISCLQNKHANEEQPAEQDLTKVKEKDGNKVAQKNGWKSAHEAKDGRGDSKVNIYKDKSTGKYWIWDGQSGSEKDPL